MTRRKYIHELVGWPKFEFDQALVLDLLAGVRHQQGRLIGRIEALGFALRSEAEFETLTSDVIKSSEIEGEILNEAQVRSSVARRLGMDVGGLEPVDRHVDGLVEMMMDATQGYQQPLNENRLFDWHAAMFPTGRSGMSRITVGDWRTDSGGPMQVISGPLGKEIVHFEAPVAGRLPAEMSAFFKWFESEEGLDPVLKSGLAHLWFITIHPFDDGNGRLARAITDMMLARSEESPHRFYSMSSQIRTERRKYYDILERTQSGSINVTEWIAWFLSCLSRAIEGAQETLKAVLYKADFWRKFQAVPVRTRQQKMVNRLLDGFQGHLTTSKWAKIANCSQDTAYRDILGLVQKGILVKNPGGGRSTSYSLVDLASSE